MPAAQVMQPSELEIQREVETLRDIKRRSTVQSGILDPDLPAVSSDSSSSTGYWDNSSSSSHGGSTEDDAFADDPFHLFWVPARLHPEIAPAEFREFLKEHARDGAALGRSNSVGSAGLGRKKSMLSRQYNPSEKDGVEEEQVVPVRRDRTSRYANQVPQLTISDLQKLEELAEEATQSHDSSKLRSVLRRSMSLNISPSVIDKMDDMPDMGDEADAPIIVPRPGQILRRAARTKIRKPGTGEGPHRFQSTRARRGSATRSATTGGETRTSSDFSSSDHGDEPVRRKRADSEILDLPIPQRPESYSEESSIYDAYAREDSDESEQHTGSSFVTTPEQTIEFHATSPPPQPLQLETQPQSLISPVVSPALQHPQPHRVVSPPLTEEPASTPVATAPPPVIVPQPVVAQPTRPPLVQSTPSYQPPPTPPAPSPSPSDHRKEKDKKGLFGKWGGDKSSKKGNKEQREKEKEKDTGFFGSLFGSKKKQDDAATPSTGGISNGGREAAAALLGASKSAKSYVPPPSPQPLQGYARYPIHVERAIYRLSHIKLANPRRPLYEQVLISNLMFWYLGVINKTQTHTQPQAQVQPAATAAAGTPQAAVTPNGNVDKDNEQAEREEKEKAERERLEKEKEREREKEKEKAEQKRRGSLTKAPAPGTQGVRRAEMPVRGPQYDMQHRAIEQEYSYQGGGAPPMPRTSSASPGPMNYQPPQGRAPGSAPAPYTGAQLVQPQPQVPNNRYYTPSSAQPIPGQQYMQQSASQLPPGAMPPVAPAGMEPSWLNSANGSVSQTSRNHTPSAGRTTSPPGSANVDSSRTRSPPAAQRYTPAQEPQPYSGPGRAPGRSLSATAVPAPQPPQVNGKLRKGNSAHAVAPPQRRTSEEEDIPLAMYKQRRK